MSDVVMAHRLDGFELSLIRQVQLAASKDAINLGVGEPTLPTPPEVCAAAAAYLSRGEVRYTLTAGELPLRGRIGALLPLHGGGADSVIVTTGTQEALALVVLGLVDPGDEILAPSLSYPAYRSLAALAGATLVEYPTTIATAFRPVAAEVAGRVTRRTRLVILASPGNPTGAVAEPAEVGALEALASERGLWLVSDEIYGDIWFGDAAPRQPRSSRTLLIGGPAKSHAMTGMRVGWLVTPPEMSRRLLPLHQQLVLASNSVGQAATHAALDLSAPGSPFPASVRAAYAERFDALDEALRALPGLRYRRPDGAFYLLADARERIGEESRRFALETAARGGVAVVPGDAFGSSGRGLLRISFASSVADIREGIRRLGLALDAFVRERA